MEWGKWRWLCLPVDFQVLLIRTRYIEKYFNEGFASAAEIRNEPADKASENATSLAKLPFCELLKLG